jgi:hypothetical protein
VRVLVDQAVEDRFSADVLRVDVSHGGADTVAFVVGNVLGDTLVRPGGPGARGAGCRPGARRSRWTTPSTAPGPDDRYRRVRVTHRFHPLFGQDFEFVAHRQNWGEDRVHLHDENGVLFSLPAGWTDVVPADPFVVIADGRCPFTAGGLLALADMIDRLRSEPDSGEAVKRIMP